MKTWILREMVICCCSTALQLQSFFREINFLILALIEHFSVKLHSCCAICTTRYLPFSFFFFTWNRFQNLLERHSVKKEVFSHLRNNSWKRFSVWCTSVSRNFGTTISMKQSDSNIVLNLCNLLRKFLLQTKHDIIKFIFRIIIPNS